jgi:putative redox protein
MPTRSVTVTLGATDFPTTIAARGHVVESDEPAEKGGTDTGLEPMELLLGSLGACTAITLRMYARRKGWALDGVHVDLALDEQQGPRMVRLTVRCDGDLDVEQRARLLQIANACPVHKILTMGAMVDTRLV